MVVDSIQTVYLPEINSGAGSISQVREAAARLQALAKASGMAIFLVGHVTKEGAIAGPACSSTSSTRSCTSRAIRFTPTGCCGR